MSLFLAAAAILLQAPPNLVVNGGFNQGQPGWSPLWTGEAGVGSAKMEGGVLSVRTTGRQDWAVGQESNVSAQPGQIFRIGVQAKSDAEGTGGVSVVVRGKSGDVVDWLLAPLHVTGRHDWQSLERKFILPAGAASVQFRFEGYGPGTFAFRDPQLIDLGNIADMRKRVAADAHLSSPALDLTVTRNGGLILKRKDGGLAFESVPDSAVLESLTSGKNEIQTTYWDVANDLDRTVTYRLDHDGKEVEVTVAGDGAIETPIDIPGAFRTQPGEWLIVPMNEGILFPVGDPSISPVDLVAYGGHGICMPWYGSMDPRTGAGLLTILETNDDAEVRIERSRESRLQIQPLWQASRGILRYARRLRLVTIPRGGYLAMASRYRQYAKQTGLLVTLAEKQAHVPAVDRLVGAMNVWTWTNHKLDLCREMKSMGMDRILWSGGGTADEIREINRLGFLSSRYDIFQDVWDPKIALSWMSTAGWPDDLVWLPDGSWMKGWAHPDKQPDGSIKWIQGGVISSGAGLARAKQTIPAELAKIPYACRFIDTTTASPWREDYNPSHPLTRGEDRKNKMALLEFCSKDEGLVVGSETGVDASVPYLDYFEGMESLGPYRLPNAGTDMMGYYKPTPEFLKFQVGPVYRLPLWELVYHDCTVAQWYWGDASNKAPEVWDRRDLFNILYGTAPLVMFDDARWASQKERVLKTYRDVCEWIRKIGYDTMTSHEFLTADHTVQRSTWNSGHWCAVNFGDRPAKVGGETIPTMGFVVR